MLFKARYRYPLAIFSSKLQRLTHINETLVNLRKTIVHVDVLHAGKERIEASVAEINLKTASRSTSSPPRKFYYSVSL